MKSILVVVLIALCIATVSASVADQRREAHERQTYEKMEKDGDVDHSAIPNQASAKARITTCIGGCMAKYPGFSTFLNKYGQKFNGLEVMFLGGSPKITFFGADDKEQDIVDVSKMEAQAIVDLLVARGLAMK
eukprot:TRINITY_DN442_c0_g1_i2.p1 TRINITY_DN442_c0_g1~~TRINITY_DN442_c0_g1_i2.p1  ORF type:complete len:133 (+),score=31.07 TRINITY_DN442_c0_g1_i2:27-425(+)